MQASPDCAPVFVVGMNGSGTTMLLDCLGRHPGLFAFPRETRLIPYLMAREASYGDLGDDASYRQLWDDVRNLAVFREANGHVPVPLPGDWREHPRHLAAVLDAVFVHFAAAQGKRRWCEKTPQHVQHLHALSTHFPGARFVHVIRDGRDCAVSFHRRWKRQPELTVFRWKKVVAMGREQGRALGAERYLEVRYEDLTSAPEASLRRICGFLDLPFDPAVLDSAQPYLASTYSPVVAAADSVPSPAPPPEAGSSPRGLRPNSGKWRGYFGPAALDRLERIAGRTLARCGYDTRYPDADLDPPAWRRRYWSARQTLRQYSSQVWRKATGNLERPWRAVLFKPVNAVRHRQHNVY